MPTRGTAFSALLVLAGAASLLSGQEPPSVFQDAIEVRVVNVEAVVTDRSGERVHGLGRESFSLTVDGVEVPIGFFSEIRDGAAMGDTRDLPLGLGIEAGKDARIPTHYLVFVDDFFSVKAQRNAVLKRLAEQLGTLGPGDEMAILAFDGRRLEVLSEWTADRARSRAALVAALHRKAGGVWRRVERLSFLARLPDQSLTLEPQGFGIGEDRLPLSLLANRRAELREQVKAVVTAAATGMRGLTAPEGRRAMLLLSGGWPLESSGLDRGETALFGTLEARGDGLDLLRYQGGFDPYSPLADTANHLGFTLYPVDVAGLSWDGPGADSEAVGAGFEGSQRGEEAVLLQLARQTGGRALLNNLRGRALEKATADTRSYYWIGFSAQARADDRRHRVRLEVLEPGLEVRSRREFVDLSRFSETKMLVEGGLLLSGGEQRSELSVELGEPRRVARRQMELPLIIGIPARRITMLPIGGQLVASLEISLGVRDKRNTLSDVLTLPVQLATPLFAPIYPEENRVVYYELDATVWRERHDLVVTVRDVPTGGVLSTRIQINP